MKRYFILFIFYLLYPRFEKVGGILVYICPWFRPSFRNTFSSKISPQPFKMETSYLVYRSTTTSCIVELQMGILLFVLPFVCSFFFLSKFFVKDISTTVKDRNFIFGIQVYNGKLYRRIENGPSPVCSSLYLFFFLSLQIFRQRDLHNRFKIETSNWLNRFTTTSCIVELKMGLLLFVPPYICSFFFPDFSSKISPQPFKNRNFKFGIQVHNDKLYRN